MTPVSEQVIENLEVIGDINTPMDTLLAQVSHAVRQGHPQVRPEPLKSEAVALVGSGPSLNGTIGELRDLAFAGAKIVALNGAAQWCIDHNLRPSAVVLLDAREPSARFVQPDIPRCMYLVASQCHARAWELVRGRERVFVWHSVSAEQQEGSPLNPEKELLDQFYGDGHWCGVVGGTTVATRAIGLLRIMGYVRFHLFGIDSCWLDGQHHAFDQPENASDRCLKVSVRPTRGDVPALEFQCAPWHLQQLEDFLKFIRGNGDKFMLDVHGNGLLAAVLKAGADVAGTDVIVSGREG